MNKKATDILKYIISAAVAGVLLYFSFREVKWEDFTEGLRTCRWEFIILSMAAGVAAFWFRGARWRQLLIPIDPQTRRITTFNAVNIGYIANFVFPRIGEFVRCGVVSRRSEGGKASYDKVLGTVVLERGWDMITMLILLILLLVARWEKFGDFFVREMWEPIMARTESGIWWIVAGAAIVIIISATVITTWHTQNKNALINKICKVLRGLAEGLSSCLKMDHKWRFFGSTALIWAMYWLMAAATMRSIPALDNLTIIDALFLSLAGSLGWLIPVPGGFGAFHFIVSLALQAIYGIPFEMGIIFATLSHESQAITMALFGCGSYAYEAFRKQGPNEEADRKTTVSSGSL